MSKKRRWVWMLLVAPLIPCCGLCGAAGIRYSRANAERRAYGELFLEELEVVRADAGEYPETLVWNHAPYLHYQRCADGGFALRYTEPAMFVLPSDFARQWDPETKSWDLKELGVDPPCP